MDPTAKAQICVPVCTPTIAAVGRASEQAAAWGDFIEIRLDCLDPAELASGLQNTEASLPGSGRLTILTFRPIEQGGQRKLEAKARLLFWLFNRPPADLFDIEFDIAAAPSLLDYSVGLDWNQVICSYHNFLGLPANLGEIYERLKASPARILKIAVQVDDAVDCIPVFELLERAQKDGREMIAIAMGAAGLATRILGPSRGAFLTYGALGDESATAPGQISARQLKEVYRIEKIDRQTKIMGLVGRPVSHSVSPQIHNTAFAESEINAVYIPFEVSDAKAFIGRMVHPRTRELDWNMRGLSVTAPHKFAVMDELDWIEPAARGIGAVNTIVVAGAKLHGYNTDARAFLKPLVQKLGSLRGVRCAIIGAGGAASAAAWALRQETADVTILARNNDKAEELAGRFGVAWSSVEKSSFAGFDLVINATSLGTRGTSEDESPANASQLRGTRLAYDLVYNPRETRFLREARDADCETLGGLPMLVAQAAEQFRLWTGSEAPEGAMLQAAEQALKS
ncbi:MAG TPA: shikimate dehydrogenase [Blastocatellia bacterium]|nr:shikimate dehydrogenase [Blastocatellia bacterium]